MIGREEVVSWLRTEDEGALAALWERADRVRRERVGNAVHLRGLVEISSHCVRLCAYCGLRAPSRLRRYRMTADEVLGCARQAVRIGCGTLVLQAGEDPALSASRVATLVRRLKAETTLAVTLSLGERDEEELRLWRAAGADRYLLRFETGNRALRETIHPARPGEDVGRLELLERLRALGYELGSGIMVGIPGQSWDDLADDLLRFRELDLDMIGIGPYLPHPGTPLGRLALGASPQDGDGLLVPEPLPPGLQVPNDEPTTLKAVALARLVCPDANIPSTTALSTLDPSRGLELGLQRGANVVMPNLTPAPYRAAYDIYPGRARTSETADACRASLHRRIVALGRTVGTGPGDASTRTRPRSSPAAGSGLHAGLCPSPVEAT